jgi:predicted RNase H-like nuclease (RuvC/YqgF family)
MMSDKEFYKFWNEYKEHSKLKERIKKIEEKLKDIEKTIEYWKARNKELLNKLIKIPIGIICEICKKKEAKKLCPTCYSLTCNQCLEFGYQQCTSCNYQDFLSME